MRPSNTLQSGVGALLLVCSAASGHQHGQRPHQWPLGAPMSVGHASRQGNSRFVDPLIGTAGPNPDEYVPDAYAGLSPTPAPPFAAIRATPMTRRNFVSSEGYYFHDKTHQGVLLTRQPAVWMGDLAPLELAAGFGAVRVTPKERSLPFSHADEDARVERYSLRVDAGSQLDGAAFNLTLAGAEHSAVLEYAFEQTGPHAESRFVVVQATRPHWRGAVYIDPARQEISGWSPERMDYKLGPHQAPNFKGFFVAQFDKKGACAAEWQGFGTAVTNATGTELHVGELGRWNEEDLAAYVTFPSNTACVRIRVGMSLISVEQARLNLKHEIAQADDAAAVARATAHKWDRLLDVVQLRNASATQERIVYTALFHALQFPSLHSEETADGPAYYSLYTDRVEKGTAYQSWSIWDTWRAGWAATILFANDRVATMVRSLLDIYLQSGPRSGEPGYLPMWANGAETNIMISTWSDSLIAEALVKGVEGFNKTLAWEAVQKNADVPPERDTELQYADREEYTPIEARAGLTYYKKTGYVPHDRTAESVSRTLDYASCDWCVSQVATQLGHVDAARFYAERAGNYRHVYNEETGFFAPRFSNGSFLNEPLEAPKARDDGFTEGNRWTYLFDVVHDLPGLAKLHGGTEKLLSKLDEYFAGGYNDHSNEPSHHVPALYAALGRAWRSQELVREIAEQEYSDRPDGLGGNEDLGQMSAWYIWVAVFGLYPINPASGSYVVVGAPFFDEVTVSLPHIPGHRLVISAPGSSSGRKYVRSFRINGEALHEPSITHRQLEQGGHWEIELADSPQEWGSRRAEGARI